MRKVLNEAFRQTGNFGTLPAPTGGWNARDAISGMGKKDAIYLDNLFPRATDVQLRKGFQEFATVPEDNAIRGLLSYSSQTGVKKLFAADDTGIFDVSGGGAVAVADTPCTDGAWLGEMFGTAGGHFLWCCNGTDNSRYYNGIAWTVLTAALTGITSADIANVSQFKHRLIFCVNDSLSFYYLPVDSISGAASEFPLYSLFKRGGYLMATANWTLDAGEGIDDYFVAVTSEGEVAIYKGTDPSDANAFALVGVFYIGQPIGRKCFEKVGGDLAVMTVRGVWPLSKALTTAGIYGKKAITDKISTAFLDYAALGKTFLGWEMCLFPNQNMFLVNMPVAALSPAYAPTSDQAVMNTETKAWCRFTGWDMHTLTVHDGNLYFATQHKVRQGWFGTADGEEEGNNSITAKCKTAFQRWGNGTGRQKSALVKPIMTVSDSFTLQMGIDVDYADAGLDTSFASYTAILSLWDEAVWDVDVWSDDFTLSAWSTVTHKMGSTLSLRLRFDVANVNITWSATEYITESGSIL